MVVTFTISLFETVVPPVNMAQSQLASSADVVLKVAEAKVQVEKKKVIIDKLGKLWAVVNLAKSMGEALSDVCLSFWLRYMVRADYMQIHPAIGCAYRTSRSAVRNCPSVKTCI